ncbi:phosphate/phosphite/phosphonate ABC transporter substrate-binding protein [Desulfurivibrio dismutans]|uniref:phosphate/phosphite/phosphonate ABC transporter substrate-binding protein n=1 Tax=Desulfurivibrio dismutans TaxID=1398908 RepID=UPI0023DAE2EA|nr:PhnD/SsuA/transferrin family substrate-binding protein [Desulfurivibrio alkaliphilus]MDF1613676.1 PhnD/SsuA/transferrin family substrate-binding protein [Desulfurivibrio alkaliphilus]
MLLTVLGGLFFSSSVAAEPLRLGVFPYISPAQMVEQLSPLRQRLATALEREVEMLSAPDFMTFVERQAAGHYDLVITAPHMGRLAQQRDGWQPVVISSQQTATVILVRADADITRLEQLKGRRLAVGNWRSVTYLLAARALNAAGLELGDDVQVLETATFSNVVAAILAGEAVAGATPTLLWDQWSHVYPEEKRRIRELFRAPPPNPHSFLLMMPAAADQATIDHLRGSLLAFHRDPAGQAFFQESNFESFQLPSEEAMALADPFVYVLLPESSGPSETSKSSGASRPAGKPEE